MSPSNTPENPKKADALPSAVEFEPPLACVRRILKHTLPATTNVGKDASAAFARASGIFIIYLTTCANDFARENKRQTITANDVLAAIKELEFDEFTPEMVAFLESYRVAEKSKKVAKAAAARQAEEDESSKLTPSKALENEEESSKAEEKRDEKDDKAGAKQDEKEALGDRKRSREDKLQDKDAAADKGVCGPSVVVSKEAPPVEKEEPDAKRAKSNDGTVTEQS